ncbi:retrotransposable element ORF2 protein [Plecturocebus cupreus]
MEYYAAIENDEFVSFVGTWINLKTIILSKLMKEQKIKHRMFSLIVYTENLHNGRKYLQVVNLKKVQYLKSKRSLNLQVKNKTKYIEKGRSFPTELGLPGFSCASQSSALPIVVLPVGTGPAEPRLKGRPVPHTPHREAPRRPKESRWRPVWLPRWESRSPWASNIRLQLRRPLALCALTASHNPELLLRSHLGSLSAR